eukprot:scpid111989/ scgid5575/ Deleted in malignant brain tumors 1 protein; Hensin
MCVCLCAFRLVIHLGEYLSQGRCSSTCKGYVTSNTAEIRLVGGNGSYGLVETYDGTRWYGICERRLSMAGAHVVCRELGIGPAIADPFEWQKSRATGSFPVNINATVPFGKNIDYYCHGSEKFLRQC